MLLVSSFDLINTVCSYVCVRIVQMFVSSQWKQLSNSKIEEQSECCVVYTHLQCVSTKCF